MPRKISPEAQQQKTIQELYTRIDQLEAENRVLVKKNAFLCCNPTIAKGLKGETLVANLLSARRAKNGAGHDVECRSGKVLIEVKYSSLLNLMFGRATKRWVWSKLFGEGGQKKFHRLLLVGDADERFSKFYFDPSSPYVFFDLPYDAAVDLVGSVKSGRGSRLQLTTNPTTVFSRKAETLFREFQTSAAIVRDKYPNLEISTVHARQKLMF